MRPPRFRGHLTVWDYSPAKEVHDATEVHPLLPTRLPDGGRPSALDQSLIGFLRQLRRAFRGQPVLLLCDGLSAHHSKAMQAYLATQSRWLEVERLPAYAPDLNPAEGFWANLKGRELANRCDLEVSRSVAAAHHGARRVRGNQQLLFSFPTPNGSFFFFLPKLSRHNAELFSCGFRR